MYLEWNDNLKTGITILDEQHQEVFIRLRNIGKFRSGKECFDNEITELQNFISIHFKTEEAYMIATKFPEYESHKACHDKFIWDLEEMIKEKDKTQYIDDIGLKVCNLVGNWILDHYSDVDIQFAKHLKQYSRL